ncbi:uncharacterized protein UTRI_01013 [Ustilago trichophora]|uniref:Uncharacterized protein n=1 Tax=Ustilago trichophora TaxID=86804 RepID=A0A5C3DVJ1_9BASI|nr:uncharacterized protein UTRI_01013 [Ustilago trichophora]
MLVNTMRIASARAMSTTAARLKVLPVGSASRCAAMRDSRSNFRVRNLHNSSSRRSNCVKATTENDASKVLATYEGPLARTFTRLKLFSLGSLGLASVLTPVLLLAPGEISLAGRIGLCVTALATSGISTALIAWIGTPYVGCMRLVTLPSTDASTTLSSTDVEGKVVMELNTISWRLEPTRTLVYEPTFLRPTSRPFAAWEITNNPPPLVLKKGQDTLTKKIAESFDVKSGKSLGSWIVKYSNQTQTNSTQQSQHGQETHQWKAVGKVQVLGKPTRYFNVHEELLGQDWQVLS